MPLAGLIVVGLVLGLAPDGWEPVRRHDKVAHGVGFALLAIALCHAAPTWSTRRVIAVGALTPVALELAQALVPGRTASLADTATGIAGIVAGAAWHYVRKRHWYGAITGE